MAAPTFVSATATANSTTASAKTTASIAVQNGDVLVAYGHCENGSFTLSIATATGSTSAWTLKEDNAGTSVNNPGLRAWTATATATGNITVTFTPSASCANLGEVKVWRGSNGVGAVNRNDSGTGTGSPTVSVTTTGANSALDFANTDWAGVTGAVTFTASNGTPVSDLSDQTISAAYCIYSAHVLDAGAIGAKTFGMSAPAGQRFICDVIEVLGTASAAITSLPFRQLEQAAKRVIAPAILAGGLFWAPQPIAASPNNTVTIDKWQQPLSKPVPVAQAIQGNAFVPFNTVQQNTTTIDKWQQPLSVAVPVAKAPQGISFAPFDTLQTNTTTVDKWVQPLSIAAPVAKVCQGTASAPFDTPQNNTATVDKWLRPLSIAVSVAKGQLGYSFVPFDTLQQSNTVAFGSWQQPLSVSVPVALAVQGSAFVPFDTQQAAPVGITGMAWFNPLSLAPPPVSYLCQSPYMGWVPAILSTSPVVTVEVRSHPFFATVGQLMGM